MPPVKSRPPYNPMETGIAPICRPAREPDLAAVHALIERAYRGDTARMGWSHEADLLSDPRTDLATLHDCLIDPRSCLLIATIDAAPVGCVLVSDLGRAKAYMGLLSVEPTLQAQGLGRQLIAEAEELARDRFAAHRMMMKVIEKRGELIAYYMRRGYVVTDRGLDFPVSRDPPLFMAELTKPLV